MNLTPPADNLIGHLSRQLRQWPPFQDMAATEVDAFVARCEQRYLAPGEVLCAPGDGPVRDLFLIREGMVHSRLGARAANAESPEDAPFVYGAGDLVPVAALMGRRAVRATYTAAGDVFVLALPAEDALALAHRSPAWAEFLQRQVGALLEKSRQALREQLASQALAEQGLEAPLGQVMTAPPVHCPPHTPLRDALQSMTVQGVGAMLATHADGTLAGILTRHDLPALMLQPGLNLQAPVAELMQRPVLALEETASAQEAALLMGEHSIRHVPVTRQGRLVGIVSERDLFALQRTSLQQVGDAIRRADGLPRLQNAAGEIRRLTRQLMIQGVQSRQLTELISQLNDRLTRRLLQVMARAEGVDLQRLCWVALGSEGRGEQTIATDQDNALVLPDDTGEAEVARLRAWADRANQALDACGYPLCRGGIMAGQPACSLRKSEWQARFVQWIDQGSPQDLLKASIFFDMRALAGDPALLEPLPQQVAARVRQTPRFLHLLAVNAMARRPPLDWRGHASADADGGLDLKLQGTALFVDAARILALAHDVRGTGTTLRLQSVGQALGLAPREYESWVGAFEFLQTLRLRAQLAQPRNGNAHPNWLAVDTLSDIDRRILAASLREARRLQQRLALDYLR